MVFKSAITVFQLYRCGKCTNPCFPEFFYSVLHTIFLPGHWPLSHTNIVEATDSGERGMNPVATTIFTLSELGIELATFCSQSGALLTEKLFGNFMPLPLTTRNFHIFPNILGDNFGRYGRDSGNIWVHFRMLWRPCQIKVEFGKIVPRSMN